MFQSMYMTTLFIFIMYFGKPECFPDTQGILFYYCNYAKATLGEPANLSKYSTHSPDRWLVYPVHTIHPQCGARTCTCYRSIVVRLFLLPCIEVIVMSRTVNVIGSSKEMDVVFFFYSKSLANVKFIVLE